MDLSFRHDRWIHALKPSPRDVGRLAGIVLRPANEPEGSRLRPDRARLTPEEGVIGDRWSVADGRPQGTQVSLINLHLLSELSGGDPEKMALAGDNLQVDLDLSEANLPVGTRLEIGEVVLEVSPEPHRPCRSFLTRFGPTAVKRVVRANRLGLRGRGVLCAVVRAGELAVGDAIRVQRPA